MKYRLGGECGATSDPDLIVFHTVRFLISGDPGTLIAVCTIEKAESGLFAGFRLSKCTEYSYFLKSTK
ncbi:hypothetical protein D3C81_2314470 [compost metagenome]